MDILRRSLAPIADEAWAEIYRTTQDVLRSVLSARKIVDVEGPKGWNYSALPTGRVDVPADQSGPVEFGIHRVLPMLESRISFDLDIWELDNVARGAQDIDLTELEEAAREIARFEENAIYNGFNASGIRGLKSCSKYDAPVFPDNPDEIMGAVTHVLALFKSNSVEGPYNLVLSPAKWEAVNSFAQGYPLRKQIENLIGGSIIMAPYIEDAYMISERGGDLKMVVGQDLSIGYQAHDTKKVRLFMTESFTFHIINDDAVAVFK